MRRNLMILVVAAGCGGSKPVPIAPPMPLPSDTKTEESKAEEKSEPKPEAKPEEKVEAPPSGPLDTTIVAPKYTVKLVSAGKGKRVALKITPKQGGKQQVELAMDFAEKQTAPPELGGDSNNVVPTVVLTGDAEVKTVDKAGKAEYQVTVSSTDARAPGALPPDKSLPPEKFEKFKQAVSSLTGLTIGGTYDANGMPGDVKLHVDTQRVETAAAIELVQFALPTLPLLPIEPVGVGAKWQVVRATKVLDKVDVTQTTDYELVDHKGNTWTIKGTTKVTGADQELEGAKLSKITGSGNVEIAIVDGALYPTMTSSVDTGFTLTASVQDPAAPTVPKVVTLTIELKQGSHVTPKS